MAKEGQLQANGVSSLILGAAGPVRAEQGVAPSRDLSFSL